MSAQPITIDRPPAPAAVPKQKTRLPFLDWTRGLAATIMLQGHVFHSFTRNDLREGGPYVLSQFLGGEAPAIFLFLTGVTLSFLMNGLEKKSVDTAGRLTATWRRAGYLALMAVLFRLQLWLFAQPYAQVSDLLKVDILNCMALAIAVLAPMALLQTGQRVRAAIVTGSLIAFASPLVSAIPEGWIPPVVRMYLVPDGRYFSFFPWAAFIVFGVAAGSILRLTKPEQMNRVMQWAAILGFGLILSAQYLSNLPYSLYPQVDFWLNSPGLIFIKLGVILVVLALAFLWTQHGGGEGWSWVRQLGTTSLLVYWVHIELVYGRWFGFWKAQLDYGQVALFAVLLIVAMIALSRASTHLGWKALKTRLDFVNPSPARVAGD